jgi:hypothetical protein
MRNYRSVFILFHINRTVHCHWSAYSAAPTNALLLVHFDTINHNNCKLVQHLMCSMSVHCIIQNTNYQQTHKESFIINCNTLLHVSTLLGHLQGEIFVTVTLRLHFTVERQCAVDCVLRCFWKREFSAVRRTAENSRLQYTLRSQQHIVTQL